MNESTVLDFVELRLSSPSSSRCELYISAEGQTEKLACGFLKTFLSHVRAAQELYAAGAGPTLRLEGPNVYNGRRRPWFTKATLERFIQYVSTPEVLERVKTIEDELIQLEQVRSIQAGNFPQAHDTFLSANQAVLRAGLFPPEYHVGHCHFTNADNSKRELLRAMDVRLSALQQEQSMVFCRATASGFDADGIEDLLAFSDYFGAEHLRVACNWFHELFSKWQRAADKLVNNKSQELKSQQSYASEEMKTGAPRRTTLMDGTHDTREVRISGMAESVTSDLPSPPDEAEAVSPVRPHCHASKVISQRMSPRRRSASPLKKVQLGRFGSRRAGSVVIRSINYFSERQSKERHQDMDTSSSDSEDHAKSYVLEEPISTIRSSPAAARRLSVQAAINLFESKQGREEGPGKQRSAKPQSRRGSLDGANTSMSGKFDLKQPKEVDFNQCSAGWQERGVARPDLDSADRFRPRIDCVARSPRSEAKCVPNEFDSEEAYLLQAGFLMAGKQSSPKKKAPYLRRGSSTSEDFAASEPDGMEDGCRTLEPAESDFSNAKSTVTSISNSEAYTEKSSTSLDSNVYQSTPTSSTLFASVNEALNSEGLKSLKPYHVALFTEKGPTNRDVKDIDSRFNGSRDCIVSSDLSIEALASIADCPLANDEVSSTLEGRFYEHYRKLRDAKMMEEQQSKRAEREAKLKSMEEILDLRKAEMDARTAKLNKDGSYAKTRAAKLLALQANLRDMQRVQEDGVVENSKIQVSSTKDCSRSDSSPPSPPLTPRVVKEQALTPKPHRSKKAVATSQKSTTTPRSSRAVSVSPKTTPRGTVGKVSSQRTAASVNISENSVSCSVPCFSDLKKENTKPSPGKPSGSAHMHSKNGGALALPPATSRTSLLESNGVIIPVQNSSSSKTTRADKKTRARQTRQSIATGELRDLASAPDDEVSVVLNTQKDVKIEAPVISKIRRSAVAPIQEVRPFLRKGTGIGPGAGPGVMKLKAEAVRSSDEDAPGTPTKASDEEPPAVVRNITDSSDGDFLPIVEGSTDVSANALSYANEDERSEVQASMISDVDVTHHSDDGFFPLCEDAKLAEPSGDDGLENERACHTISFPIDFVTHERYAATHASEPDAAPQQVPREEEGRREVSATLSQLLSESAGQEMQNEHLVNGSASFRANLASEEHSASRFSPMKAASLASSSLKRPGAAIPDYFSPSTSAAIVESPVGSPASWNSSQVQYASENDVTRSQKKVGSSQKPVVVIVPPKEPARGFKRLLKFGRKSRAALEIFVTDGVSASTPSEGDDDIEEVNKEANLHSAQDALRKVKLQERILKDFGIANANGSIGNISDKGSVQSLQTSIPIPPSNFELKYDHAPGTSKLKAPRSFFSLSTFRSRGSEGKSR